MTWHRSDDGFPEHPKSDALAEHFGDDWAACAVAFMTWHHMGCDCASRRTDGVFNASRAHRVVRAPREVVDRALAGLLKVKLLDKHRDGFVFHDWAQYQPTRAELEAERASKAERQQRWRENRRVNRTDVDGGVDASTSRLVDGGVDASRNVDETECRPCPVPSRPVPSRPVPSRPVLLPSVGGVQGNREGVTATADASAGPDADAPPSEDSAKRAARRPRQPRAPAAPETAPLPGTDARRVFDAVTVDRALGARLRSPAAWSERVVAGAFPALGVHGIVREIARAGAWVADQPPSKAPRDAGAFLRNWLARADRDAASDPRAVAGASEPRRVRLPPPPPPAPPPPPPSTPEQRAATDALLTRLRDEAQRRVEESRRRITVIEPVGADSDDDLEDDHD